MLQQVTDYVKLKLSQLLSMAVINEYEEYRCISFFFFRTSGRSNRSRGPVRWWIVKRQRGKRKRAQGHR